jgi:hypothetical protein
LGSKKAGASSNILGKLRDFEENFPARRDLSYKVKNHRDF